VGIREGVAAQDHTFLHPSTESRRQLQKLHLHHPDQNPRSGPAGQVHPIASSESLSSRIFNTIPPVPHSRKYRHRPPQNHFGNPRFATARPLSHLAPANHLLSPRSWLFALLACLPLLLAPPAHAHVAAPTSTPKATPDPTSFRSIIRAPLVIPGVAEVEVHSQTPGIHAIAITPSRSPAKPRSTHPRPTR